MDDSRRLGRRTLSDPFSRAGASVGSRAMDRLRLNPSPASVAKARQFSQSWLDSAGVPELVDVVALLVSELVTNVVLHARTPCELSLERRGDRLRLAVADQGAGMPVRKAVD